MKRKEEEREKEREREEKRKRERECVYSNKTIINFLCVSLRARNIIGVAYMYSSSFGCPFKKRENEN